MDDQLFAELLDSAHEALEHARGKRELRTTVLPPPLRPVSAAGVRKVRKRLKVSQAVLAHYLNVSTKLVQAWESGRRRPDGPALLLLRLAARRPELLISSYHLAAGAGGRRISEF
jgi:putative transcriptional regulator